MNVNLGCFQLFNDLTRAQHRPLSDHSLSLCMFRPFFQSSYRSIKFVSGLILTSVVPSPFPCLYHISISDGALPLLVRRYQESCTSLLFLFRSFLPCLSCSCQSSHESCIVSRFRHSLIHVAAISVIFLVLPICLICGLLRMLKISCLQCLVYCHGSEKPVSHISLSELRNSYLKDVGAFAISRKL